MQLRRTGLATLLALAALACAPSVPSNPPAVVTAAFDPTGSPPVIPLPNSLALQLVPPHPADARQELLAWFRAQGGFPYDQPLPITIPFVVENVRGPGDVVLTAPELDLASLRTCTAATAPGDCSLLVLDATGPAGAEYPALDPPTYAAGPSAGSLTVQKALDPVAKNRLWRPGATYFYAVRGGPEGARTTSGEPVNPSATTYALLFADDLPPAASILQQQYQVVFAAVEAKGFPKAEIAVVGTFTIAPGGTWVQADPSSGQVPLPSNFLLDVSTGRVSTRLDALVPFASTLDGFSTTAVALAPTSGPVQAVTVRDPGRPSEAGAFLYRIVPGPGDAPGTAVQVPDLVDGIASGFARRPVFVTQPPELARGGLASAVALQPGVPVAVGGPPSPGAPGQPPTQVSLPPLEEGTTYAVVITDRIRDAQGLPLSKTTLGRIVLFSNPLCTPSPACASSPQGSRSELPGLSPADAAGLEAMRLALPPVVAAVEADHGLTRDRIAMVYTFRTQSISLPLAMLVSAPYALDATAPVVPGSATSLTPAQAFARFGVDPASVPGVRPVATPSGTVEPVLAEVIEAPFPALDFLDPATGAFRPDPAQRTPAILQALVAVPDPAKVAIPACPAGSPVPRCAPLVVFHHGLGGGRADMLLVANQLAARGFVVASLDAPLHGLRSYCREDADCTTATTSGTCTPIGPPGTQGDSEPPGLCSGGSVLAQRPVLCPSAECRAAWAAVPPHQRGGVAASSGSYALSANLFRTRDSLRQGVADVSALVLALARPPPPELPALPAPSPVAARLAAAHGIAVDPRLVHYEGISLGGLAGTLHLAANPRFSRGVLNVGGATIVDILTTAPAFAGLAAALLPPPGTPEHLRFVLAAKWILDPADPLNSAGHILRDTFPNPLAGDQPQPPKQVLGQWAACDPVVPNATSVQLYDVIGLGAASPSASTSVLYVRGTPADASHTSCPLGTSAAPHGFLADWGLSAAGQDAADAALTRLGQDQAAAFLADPTSLPPPVQP
jgi:hypothetical protein